MRGQIPQQEITMPLYTPHRNSGSSRYCGPTAIMAVTGCKGSDVSDAIRQARGFILDAGPPKWRGSGYRVAGLSNNDLLAAMKLLGWNITDQGSQPKVKLEIKLIEAMEGRDIGAVEFFELNECSGRAAAFKRYTFSQFLTDRGHDGPFIVNVTGHYLAVSHGEVCDGATTMIPIEIDRYLKGRGFKYHQSWVRAWWKFTQSIEAENQ
jgi:hypothetical protein